MSFAPNAILERGQLCPRVHNQNSYNAFMQFRIFPLILSALLLSLIQGHAQDKALVGPSQWERSLIKIEVTSKQFDYYQPWNQRSARNQKVGIVTGPREIITEAEYLSNQTLLRIQKNGRGKWWIGKLVWVDHPANLAMITVEDDAFWQGVDAVNLGGHISADAPLQIIKWNGGVLESSKASFMRFAVEQSETSGLNFVVYKVHTDLQGGGWGQPLVWGTNIVGMANSQSENVCTITPASFIKSIIEAHRGDYRGLGYFHFFWQAAENIVTLEHLGQKGEPRGVLVTRAAQLPDGSDPVLKARDVIMQIDGFDIDIQGDYKDPEFGYLMLENLATRRKWAGDKVPMKILRDGKEMDITYTLPKYEYKHWLMPSYSFDQEPEYFIMGGLIFQPLSAEYLRAWGADWRRRAPFRLNYYSDEDASKEQPSLVILSQVLPDPYNIGYQEQKYLVVEKINGKRITLLTDLLDAFKSPTNNFHVIDFKRGTDLQRIVLAAGSAERDATRRILQRYGITDEFRFAPKTTAENK
jgi:hypothetical protein